MGKVGTVVGERTAVGIKLVGGVVIIGMIESVTEASAEGEASPAVGPVDVGADTFLLSVEVVGAEGIDEGAVVVVVAFIVVVGALYVGA